MVEQNELNREMSEIGVGRFNAQWESARKHEEITRSKVGQRIMRELLPEYVKRIKQLLRKKPGRPTRWANDLRTYDCKKVAYISFRVVLDNLPLKKSLTSLAYAVGKQIEREVMCSFLVKTNPKGKGIIKGAKTRSKASQYRHIQLSMRNEEKKEGMENFDHWARRDRISCGLNLVELLRVSTGLIEYVYVKKNARSKLVRFVAPTASTLEWIEKFNQTHSLLDPFWMPMVEPPENWDNVWDGGYKSLPGEAALPKLPFIKSHDKEFLRNLDPKKLKVPMEAVNLIQRTPWEINQNVLAVILWAWENNVEVEGLPSKEDEELPPFPPDGEENRDSRNAWAKIASGIHKRNLSTRSKRMLTSKVVYLAEKFAGERIFLPCNVDFRGRVYYAPTFCNPMGNDLCRGMLQFWREEKIRNKEEAKWLAIHGSNSYGNDKVSLDDREAWAYDNADMIKSIAMDPIGDLRWIDADAPFSFLAFCFEWRVFLEKGKLKTKLPVMMDATNNGLQLLSILTRCEYGCSATNVTPNDEGVPADIYTTARLRCESYMRKDAKNGHPFAQAWLDYGIDRACLKRPTMTKAYGLTEYSCRQYVLDWFEDKIHSDDCPSPFCEKEYYKAVHYLSSMVWKAIEEILDLPKRCMDWFVEVAQIVSAEGRPLMWTTPSGFVVKQDYKKVKDNNIKTWISGHVIHVKFHNSTDKVSVVRQKNGVSPNTIHSYDSALLHKVVCKANNPDNSTEQGIYDFCMIHDSFGTHSNKAQLLADTIRSEAVKMFTPDLLREWLSEIKKQNPDLEFPEPPEYGSADISLIRDSPYFFS